MAVTDNPTSKRQRRTAAEINEILSELKQSGLSRARFAQEHGFGYSTLCSWVYRSRSRKEASPWVEVSDAMRPSSPGPSSPYRLEWTNGINLELSREFESQKVGELINLIQSQCLL